ncbi:esterase B1-like [Contarinia nasturtii]|uniref:esterase B1-like n=1 Tax=Contarinia nasturtii TaxID=265458 RepID=UPI0012D45E46|nr:esterase B1-like [Contarinia nasturtii]
MMRFSMFLVCITLLNIVNYSNQIELKKTVVTKSGPIRGKLQSTIWLNKPYYSFRGIPYAKPPVGKLRFKAPEPIEKWPKTIDAYDYGSWCAQVSKHPTSENCLFLNIFVPKIQDTKKLPVLFFIHGGFFARGSADDSQQGPDHFIDHEVILVTANYRLGIFGFMSLGTPQYSGNMGLKDQQLAMKWIHENIEAFGGDRYRITLGGLSAGGNCVGLHLINEESSKYFNQILSISGTPNRFHNYQTGDHRCLIENFYSKHSKDRPSDKKLINFLQKANVTDIINFFHETFNKRYSPWNPVVEKTNAIRAFIVDDPITALEKIDNIDKPAYYTITEYEHLSRFLIYGTNYSHPRVVRKYIEDFNIDLPIFGYKSIIDKKPPYLKTVLKNLHNFYFNVTTSTTDQELLRQRLVLDSDLYYVYAHEKWMEQHVAISKKDTFYHRFSLQTIINPHPEYPGAGHADESQFIFRCTLYANASQVKENMKADRDSAIAFHAMDVMQKLFANFIKYGKPIHNADLMSQEFKPIQRSSNSDEFDFVDVTNSGLFPGKAPFGSRTKFLDHIIEEVKRLVKKNGDTPKKTQVQQLCERMNFKIMAKC